MRRKLKIDPENLDVTSFEVGAAGPASGTVEARMRYTFTDPRVCEPSDDWYCSVGERCTWPAYGC
jgi:hypothetical protein